MGQISDACWPWQMLLVATKAAIASGTERAYLRYAAIQPDTKSVVLASCGCSDHARARSAFCPLVLPLTSSIRRVPANVRLPALVLEIDLRLIQRRVKQIVGVQLHARPGRRADAQPVEPQGVAAGDPILCVKRQEVLQSLLLSAIEHVALKLGDDKREARDLGREVAQFDAAKVGEREFGAAVGLAAPLVYLGLDRRAFPCRQ